MGRGFARKKPKLLMAEEGSGVSKKNKHTKATADQVDWRRKTMRGPKIECTGRAVQDSQMPRIRVPREIKQTVSGEDAKKKKKK